MTFEGRFQLEPRAGGRFDGLEWWCGCMSGWDLSFLFIREELACGTVVVAPEDADADVCRFFVLRRGRYL